jgi:HSP20 family molecular chaperone IbpA
MKIARVTAKKSTDHNAKPSKRMPTTFPIKKAKSILDELEQMHDRIEKRAFEIFHGSDRTFGRDLDDWLAAERELIWKPSVELTEKDNEFSLRIAVPGVDPKHIDIEVTPECLLVKGEAHQEHEEDRGHVHVCEFESGNLFRSIQFPKKINPGKVKAEFKNGVLLVNAGIAVEARTKKIDSKHS